MSVQNNPSQLVMTRGLTELPPIPTLPRGYSIGAYRDGDDVQWERVIGESFRTVLTPGFFSSEMAADTAFDPKRILFIRRGRLAVATASAWFRPSLGAHVGYLHYVGVVPLEARQGFGYLISLACMHMMQLERRQLAYLHTDDFRTAAIRLYVKLGFRPDLDDPDHRERWLRIYSDIDQAAPSDWQ